MTEVLIREQIEIERKRDDERKLDRLNGVEREHAILKTRFEATLKWFEEALARAVSQQDLKDIKLELESRMKDMLGELRGYVVSANDQQESNIIGKVQTLLAQQDAKVSDEQRSMRRQIFMAVFGSGLSVIAALIVFKLTSS